MLNTSHIGTFCSKSQKSLHTCPCKCLLASTMQAAVELVFCIRGTRNKRHNCTFYPNPLCATHICLHKWVSRTLATLSRSSQAFRHPANHKAGKSRHSFS